MQEIRGAIDAGGTNVRLRVFEVETGKILVDQTVPAEPHGGPAPALLLLETSGVAPTALVAGITKFTRPGVASAWRRALNAYSLTLVPDYEIAFWAAVPDGVGISVLAGTGSVVFGRNTEGNTLRVGGRGWEYGDEGSGTHLTTDLVRRTLRALDGLERLSPLQFAVCELLGTNDPGELVQAARDKADADGRGFLVPLVLERAQAGEGEAEDLFVGAAGWLATYAGATLNRLGFTHEDAVEVRGIGGLWSAGELLTEPFQRVLARRYPAASFALSEAEPLEGAVRLACRGTTEALNS
ncbi:MAG: BadF/BadG/BcrA/BcrD ATPase family protein [Armatimonas sp.]